jgi:protein tyrosine/serine phosphatase
MYWHNVLSDQLFPKRFVEVEEGSIFRSGQISSGLLRDVFVEYDIQMIVDLAGYEPKYLQHQYEEDRIARELGIEHLRLPLQGNGTGDLRVFALAIAAIDRARREQRPVLVHCTAGSRRSAAVLAIYQLLVEGDAAEDAFQELRRFGASSLARSAMVPFLNSNMDTIARALVELEVIDRVPDPLPRFPWEP